MTAENPTTRHAKEAACSLCGQRTLAASFSEDGHPFCCAGCRAVYTILSTKEEIFNFKEHPLFEQAVKSGLIAAPAMLDQHNAGFEEESEDAERHHFEVDGLFCPSCAEVITLLLKKQKGVRACVVDYATDLGVVDYNPKKISKEKIFHLIKSFGYTPHALENQERKAVQSSLFLRFAVSAFFSLNIMMLSYPVYASYFFEDYSRETPLFAWLSFFCALPVLFFGGWPIFRRCINAALFGKFGMEALITAGVLAAFGLSSYELIRGGSHIYFDSMSVIISFVLLGKMIESKAKFFTKETLFRLAKSIPKRGRKRVKDGKELFVPLKEVDKGDSIVCLAGEKVVLDGIVKEGEALVDESLITGEAKPVKKGPQDNVVSGSLLIQGRLVAEVSATLQESTLRLIIDAIERDVEQKERDSPVLEKFLRFFVPLVACLAFGAAVGIVLKGGAWQEALVRATSIFLISCPCAIGIAAPLAESKMLVEMAKIGAVVRNRRCLSFLGKEDVVVFDKTGTITKGRYQVLAGLEALSEEESQVLKAMAAQSIHPAATAIGHALHALPAHIQQCEEVVGKGLFCRYGDASFYLGSLSYVSSLGVQVPVENDARPLKVTRVYFCRENSCLAEILLGDEARDEAKEVIERLKPARTHLLSGDAGATVAMHAQELGFDSWQAEASPFEKREAVETLKQQGMIVAMIGDGVNDAPALIASHIGISFTKATDLSQEVSDIVLTHEDLQALLKARQLAVSGRRILVQNLFWAFFYNAIGLAAAVCGALHPVISAAAMALSSLVVLLNAQRIR